MNMTTVNKGKHTKWILGSTYDTPRTAPGKRAKAKHASYKDNSGIDYLRSALSAQVPGKHARPFVKGDFQLIH